MFVTLQVAAWLEWRLKNKPSKPPILTQITRPPAAFSHLLANATPVPSPIRAAVAASAPSAQSGMATLPPPVMRHPTTTIVMTTTAPPTIIQVNTEERGTSWTQWQLFVKITNVLNWNKYLKEAHCVFFPYRYFHLEDLLIGNCQKEPKVHIES